MKTTFTSTRLGGSFLKMRHLYHVGEDFFQFSCWGDEKLVSRFIIKHSCCEVFLTLASFSLSHSLIACQMSLIYIALGEKIKSNVGFIYCRDIYDFLTVNFSCCRDIRALIFLPGNIFESVTFLIRETLQL